MADRQMSTREHCVELDLADPLAAKRDAFALPFGVIYLDGNSLGPLPRCVAPRLARTVSAATIWKR